MPAVQYLKKRRCTFMTKNILVGITLAFFLSPIAVTVYKIIMSAKIEKKLRQAHSKTWLKKHTKEYCDEKGIKGKISAFLFMMQYKNELSKPMFLINAIVNVFWCLSILFACIYGIRYIFGVGATRFDFIFCSFWTLSICITWIIHTLLIWITKIFS